MWHFGGVLTPQQQRDGFETLEDEDYVYIKRYGEVCLVLSARRATKKFLRKAVDSLRDSDRACV